MLEIKAQDVIDRIAFDNPWWGPAGPATCLAFQNEPRRKYFWPFYRMVKDTSVNRAIVLMGPRRVGKTVMLYQAVRRLLDDGIPSNRIFYASLETPLYTGLALEKLLSYFRGRFDHPHNAALFVFFDEVQYLRDWEVHLKSLVDSYPGVKFVATGSAAAALRLKSRESGAGRFSDFILSPLTFAEYLAFIGREEALIQSVEGPGGSRRHVTTSINELNAEFVNYLNFGGYHEAVFSETIQKNPDQYIKSDIIDEVLLRDLPSLYGISDIQELSRLFTTLAYNTGLQVNIEGLSQSSGVAKNTVRRYFEYLEAAFLVRRVERIDQNAKRFKRAVHFKVYLANPSMRAALFGRLDTTSDTMGALAETAIYSQWQHSKSADLHYARWSGGEVDMVLLAGADQRPLWVTEIKWSDRPRRALDELSSCLEFVKRNPGIRDVLVTSLTI
ncbi:ATP-binding protein [Acidiferrobacter sp.]